ncbi:hypothetical protein PG985_002048 [Apiospora marii]|uniref:uncharacterized protein n=1 Tax=Apiospora marii TaxID=335849 RepID=UPI003131B588
MDGSRSHSRDVSRGRSRRTSYSRSRGTPRPEGSQGAPPLVNEWDQIYPPNQSQPSQSRSNDRPPAPARRDSSKSKRSTSASQRFKGTTVDNALSKVGRVVRSMLEPRPKNIKGCPKHDEHYCIPCMCNIDITGKISKDGHKIDVSHKVDEPPVMEVEPLFGQAAQLDTVYDSQMRSTLNAQASTPTNVPSQFITPSRRWFAYCAKCGVTYLAGKAGKNAAADHPSHISTDLNDRSICVYVDAGVSEDGQGTLIGDSSVFFGPKSPHNAVSNNAYDLEHHQSIQISALRRALRQGLTILEERRGLVDREAMSNSQDFLWKCLRFRLLIFSRMEAVHSWLNLDRAAMGSGQLDPRLENDLTKIDEDVRALAAQGVPVQFFTLPAFHSYEPEYELFYDRFI